MGSGVGLTPPLASVELNTARGLGLRDQRGRVPCGAGEIALHEIRTMAPVFGMFGVGPTELIVVSVVVLLLFGNRLPSVMRSLGRGVVEFKKGVQGIEDDLSDAKPPANRDA